MKRLLADSDLFHQMFDDSPAFFALLRGPEFVFEMVNKAYLALLPNREPEGKTVKTVLPEVETQGYLDLLNRVYTTGEVFRGNSMAIMLHDPDGHKRQLYLDFVYQPIKDDGGKVVAIFVQGSDVTERKHAENLLRDSEERYRLLFQSIDQGYCVIKVSNEPGLPLDYQFVEVNDAFGQQSGIEQAEGQWVRQLHPQLEEFWFKTYRDVAVTGQPVRFEHESKELQRWFSVYAFRIGQPEEMLVAILFSDITQRVMDQLELKAAHDDLEVKVLERTAELERSNLELAEAKRIAERASQAKSDILSNTSHELRTPLNSLLLISQLLVENPEKNFTPKQRKYVDVIYESGQDLLMLVNDLLDMAQIESGVSLTIQNRKIDWKHLYQSLNNNFNEVAGKKGLEFKVSMAPNLPLHFVSDERRLLQVLKNLLSNAFKFTKQGSVSLDIQPQMVNGVEDGGRVEFKVTDTGIGISKEKLKLIFEAFHQAETGTARQYGGTGLGLAISRELTQMMGGSLSVESEPGAGSVFRLTLPCHPPTSEATSNPKNS